MIRAAVGEEAITVRGYRLLWCFDSKTGEHFYMNLDNDTPLTQEDFDYCFNNLGEST